MLRVHDITDKALDRDLIELEVPKGKEERVQMGDEVRIPTAKEALYMIYDKAQEEDEDPPKNRILSEIFRIHERSVIRIKSQWREERGWSNGS